MMLVLSRKVGEWLVIQLPDGETVEVKIIAITEDGKAKLGFLADRSIKIDRAEMRDRRTNHGPQDDDQTGR